MQESGFTLFLIPMLMELLDFLAAQAHSFHLCACDSRSCGSCRSCPMELSAQGRGSSAEGENVQTSGSRNERLKISHLI